MGKVRLERDWAAQKKMRQSKYRSKKTKLDGILFDSQKEALRYAELKTLLRAGEIVSLERQPVFVLQEGFERNGRRVRPVTYRADFRVTYRDGKQAVIDVKGYRTKEYLLKKKLFLAKFPEIDFREE